jgi:hypothetical protein
MHRRGALLVSNWQMQSDATVKLISVLAEFAKFISDETEKWGKVVKFAGIKPK